MSSINAGPVNSDTKSNSNRVSSISSLCYKSVHRKTVTILSKTLAPTVVLTQQSFYIHSSATCTQKYRHFSNILKLSDIFLITIDIQQYNTIVFSYVFSLLKIPANDVLLPAQADLKEEDRVNGYHANTDLLTGSLLHTNISCRQ